MTESDPLAQTRQFYDTVAQDYARLLPDTRYEAPTDRAAITAFVEYVLGGGCTRVLDAGCGTGRLTRLLVEAGSTVEGVDLSPGMIALAREAHPSVSFAVGSIDDLPTADSSVGGILAWYSLIHTAPHDLPLVFAEFFRSLVPGGWALLGFQVGIGTRHLAQAYGHDVDIDPYLFTADQLAGIANTAGLLEHARIVRVAEPPEKHGQAQLLLRKPL